MTENSEVAETPQYKPPDGGYGWFLVVVTVFVYAIMFILMASFTVLYMEFVEAFDSNVVVVGTVISYQALVTNFSGLFGSGLLKLFDVRLVAMSGALISACFCFVSSFSINITMLGISYAGFGVGNGIAFMSLSSVIQQYFDKKRTLANGFVMAGISLGNFCVPPLTRLALDTLGWRMTLSLFACVLMQNVWLCAFYRPATPRKKDVKENSEDSRCKLGTKCSNYLKSLIDVSFLKDPIILLFLVSCFCMSVSFIGYYINLVNKAISDGVNKYTAAFVASVSGIVNAIWRPTFGVLATLAIIRDNKYFVLSCLLLLFGISLGVLAAVDTFETIIVAVCFISLSVGSISTLHIPTLADMVEPEKLPGALGLVMAFAGTGQFCSPMIAGWAYDITGSYDIPYYILGGFSIVASIANFMIIPIAKRRSRNSQKSKADVDGSGEVSGITGETKRPRHYTVDSLGSGVASTWSLAL